MQKQTAKMKSTRKTGQEEPELKKSTLEKSQPWRKVNGQSQRKSTVWSTSWSTMTSANWRVTSADDVAVMTSPRADVSRWTPGVCRHVGKSDKAWRRMTVRDGMWSAWAFAQNILATREGAWELRWWLGFHDRVDRRRKILIVPAKTQSEQRSLQRRYGNGLETLNDGNCKSRTKDNDWNASEVEWQMAAAAVVKAEAIVSLK